MVEVLEQPGIITEGIGLQPVQVALKRVERTHTALEEGCIWLLFHADDGDLCRFLVPALLHHLTVVYGEAGLDVAVGLHHLTQCGCKSGGI